MPEPPAQPEPVRVTFSRGTWVVLVVFGTLMLAGIVTQLLLIEDQRSTTDRQLKTAVRQANSALPLIRETKPLVDRTRQALPQVAELGRETQAFLDAATPLAQELRDARTPEQLQAAGALARTLLQADIDAMVRELRAADLPRLAGTVQRLAGDLLRAARSVPQIEGMVRQSLGVQRETVAMLRQSLAVQRETLTLTRELTTLAREATAAAERAARAAESIDRKTGPSLSPASGG